MQLQEEVESSLTDLGLPASTVREAAGGGGAGIQEKFGSLVNIPSEHCVKMFV